ncbi:serum response factor-binding protein 1-like [Hydractinia symbiolongicarpus]|uniref:serum response factor-binding protein 1-like n=1 Tax=Hydractinia symbiolongicarpus TaxID=13093 RepID=UPI00254D0BA8|nr:serum response factor-binding protein 1-like [Hydractinia symbiolongicarpus]
MNSCEDKENLSDELDKNEEESEEESEKDGEEKDMVENNIVNEDIKEIPGEKGPKKVGPQKQKKLIHTLLKKAKIYEIRKLTRRIETLRKLKGTEQQIEKNNRKVEKLLKEIDAMKSFIIETLTERTVDVFKNSAEEEYREIWRACEEQKNVEALLQTLSRAENSDEKYSKMAYLRMLSSKDIVGKLKLISLGVNINPKKDKNRSKRALKKNKKNEISKKIRKQKKKEPTTENKATEPHVETKSEVTSENKSQATDKKLKNKKESKDISNESKGGRGKENTTEKTVRKKKRNVDSFFLDGAVTLTDSGDDSEAEDNEFSAPVDESKVKTHALKKNRMGQRQRKKLLETRLGKRPNSNISTKDRRDRNFSRKPLFSRRSNSGGFRKQDVEHKTRRVKTEKKDVDKTLHPSWQAKQKQKAQQHIVAFAGTKITFD